MLSRCVLVSWCIQAAAGLALAGSGVWLAVELWWVLGLRNANHYRLDYRVYWAQVTPWLHVAAGVAAVGWAFVACAWRKRGILSLATLAAAAACLSLAAAALTLVFAAGEETDRFVTDAVLDGFRFSQTDDAARESFGALERRMQCCGASEPRDYATYGDTFSPSCCEQNPLFPLKRCELTDRSANGRHGCSEVVRLTLQRYSHYVSGAAIGLAALQLLTLILTLQFTRRNRLDRSVDYLDGSEKVPLK